MALTVWLAALGDKAVQEVALNRVECQDTKLDLAIRIRAEVEKRPSAYSHRSDLARRVFHTIVINTAPSSRPWATLTGVFPGGFQDLKGTIQRISFLKPTRAQDFLPQGWAKTNAIRDTSYRVLIHELGHAFGLCDTYAEGIHQCDKDRTTSLVSERHPASVMKSDDFFYLTSDDQQGMRTLFYRFLTESKSGLGSVALSPIQLEEQTKIQLDALLAKAFLPKVIDATEAMPKLIVQIPDAIRLVDLCRYAGLDMELIKALNSKLLTKKDVGQMVLPAGTRIQIPLVSREKGRSYFSAEASERLFFAAYSFIPAYLKNAAGRF